MSKLFYGCVTLVLFFSVSVINNKNPIFAVFSLILVFFNITIVLLLLEVNFAALTMVLVYIGAVAVLFLFVLFSLETREKFKKIMSCSDEQVNSCVTLMLTFLTFFNFLSIFNSNVVSVQFYQARSLSFMGTIDLLRAELFSGFSRLAANFKLTVEWFFFGDSPFPSISTEYSEYTNIRHTKFFTIDIEDVYSLEGTKFMKKLGFNTLESDHWPAVFKANAAQLFLCTQNDIHIFGFLLYTHFSFLLIMSGWILTIAMISSIHLALVNEEID